MTKALKRTIFVVMVIAVAEMVTFGVLLRSNNDAYAASEVPALEANEPTYVRPITILVPPTETIEETEEPAQPVQEEVDVQAVEMVQPEAVVVDDEGNWYYETYDDEGERILVPYDGSGHYNANINGAWHSGGDFMFSGGSGYDDGSGFSFTWYSENVLPGGGLDIPGRHVGDEGYVCDENGNVCLASDYLPEGTVVDIPFGNGTGVVYDSGSGYDNLDVYVSW